MDRCSPQPSAQAHALPPQRAVVTNDVDLRSVSSGVTGGQHLPVPAPARPRLAVASRINSDCLDFQETAPLLLLTSVVANDDAHAHIHTSVVTRGVGVGVYA